MKKRNFPAPRDSGVLNTSHKYIRTARGRFIQQGGRWSNKLLGQSAILLIDPKAPWFVLAQFDDLEHKYWSHGWHPFSALAFGGIQVQHVLDDEPSYCLACGMTEDQLMQTAEDDCKVLDLESTVEFKDSPDLTAPDEDFSGLPLYEVAEIPTPAEGVLAPCTGSWSAGAPHRS